MSEIIVVENLGMGWLRDFPDYRDFTPEQDTVPRRLKNLGQKDSVKTMLKKAGVTAATKAAALPASMDLRPWCSPIENQGNLGSCTANAGVGLVEYFERRAFNTHLDARGCFCTRLRVT